MLNALTNSSTAIPAAVPGGPLLVEKLTKHANRREVDEAVTLMLDLLTEDPEAAATLLPGFKIVRAPMTPAMRAAMSLPKANEKRRIDNEERVRGVRVILEDQLARDHSISDRDLAAALNEAGLRTYTGLPYNTWRVRTLLNKIKRE